MQFTIRFVNWRLCKRLERISPLLLSPTSISLSSAFSLLSFSSLSSALKSSAPSAKSNDNCVLRKRIENIIDI